MSVIALATAAAVFHSAPCTLEELPAEFEKQNGVECGWVSVPRDRSSGKSIRLWTAIVRASGPVRKSDPILYIHGGPGIATVDSLVPALPTSANLKALRQDRDIILFDQRGSGRSEEALCPDLAETLNAISASGLSPAMEEERNRAAFATCRSQLQQAGVDLQAYSTTATVAAAPRCRQR